MTMENSKENLSLLDNRLSDFKLELGRIKDEVTNAVDALQPAYLSKTESENLRALYSNIETFIKSVILKGNNLSDFRDIVLSINNSLDTFDVTKQLQIRYGNDEFINKFLDIFIKDYGFIKFYSQSKDQVLLDFDLMIDEESKQEVPKQTEKGKAPVSDRRKREEGIRIFDKEKDWDRFFGRGTGGEEGVVEAEFEDDEEPPENKEEVSKEDEFTRDSIVENLIKISESEKLEDFEKYDEEYHIAQFSFKIFYTKKDGSEGAYTYGNKLGGRRFYCAIAKNNYFLATKSGKIIIADTLNSIKSDIESYAARLVDTKPEGFIKFIELGGRIKRKFKETLPDVAGDNKKSRIQSVIAHNFNYSANFFDRAEPTLYNKFDAKSRRLKREGKLDLDLFDELKAIYPEFSEISYHNMIMYIDESTSPARMVFDKDTSEKFNNFVNNKLLEINRDMQNSFLNASSISDIKRVEEVRYSNGKKLDDLISACRIRDYLLKDKYTKISASIHFKVGYEFDSSSLDQSKLDEILISNVLKNNTTIIGQNLFTLTQVMCFSYTNYIASFAERMTSFTQVKEVYDKEAILNNEDLINDSFEYFSKNFRNQLSSKILHFFDFTLSSSSYSYCQYISSSLQLSLLLTSAYNVAAKPVRLGWHYISCPTCKKDIYYSKYKVSPTGIKGDDLSSIISSQLNIPKEKAKVFIDPQELSDYKEIRYSFFTKNGKLITTKMLEDAARLANKDWNNILLNISSNSQSLHIQGIKDSESLLQSLGAVEIKRNKSRDEVFAFKTKCPFPDGNMPDSLVFNSTKGEKKYKLKDFSCGLSLNVEPLLSSDRKIDPFELQSCSYEPDVNQELKLSNAVDNAISRGIISLEEKDKFIAELNKRRSGGWKFSNTMFRCPCRPSSDELDANRRAYKYLASPATGVFKGELFDSGLIHPPTKSDGDLNIPDDYTVAYLVCGNLTSISSFVRDTSDPESLYGILKRKFDEAIIESNTDSSAYISNFINTLLQLGIDFNDILPFIDKIYGDTVKTAISLEYVSRYKNIIKYAIDQKNMSVSSHDGELNITRLQAIGTLKLSCSNGHKFRIVDSIRFGNTHTAHRVNTNYTRKLDSAISLSKKNGKQNLISALNTYIPTDNDKYIISRVNSALLPETMMDISEWDGRWDPDNGLSQYFFRDEDGYCYIFENRSKKCAWGAINKDLSVMPFLKLDRQTKLIMSANPLLMSDSSSTSSETGEVLSIMDKFSFENFDSSIEEITSSAKNIEQIETTAHERAKLDIYYSPLAVLIQSMLYTIKDYCNKATSEYIDPILHGDDPSKLKDEDKIKSLLKDIGKDIYIKQGNFLEEDDELISETMPKILESISKSIDEEYIKYIKSQDIKLLSIMEKNVSPVEKPYILRMLLGAVNRAIGKYAFDLVDLSSRIYDDEFASKIKEIILSSNIDLKLDEVVNLIKSNFEKPRQTAVSGLMRGEEKLMVSNLQSGEYMGRVLMLSSALYLSEAVSRLYRKYLKFGSKKYIGVDIGIDLSSPDFIINKNVIKNNGNIFMLSDEQISSIPTTFPFETLFDEEAMEDIGLDEEILNDYSNIDLYQEYLIDEISNSKARLLELTKKRENLQKIDRNAYAKNEEKIKDRIKILDRLNKTRNGIIKIINEYLEEYSYLILEFFLEFKDEISHVQTACTNIEYTTLSVELMRLSISKKIESYKDQEKIDTLKIILNRCMTTSPITVMSLLGDDKYHQNYAGEGSVKRGGPYRMLPLFNADQVFFNDVITSLKETAYPIYALSDSDNTFENLGIQQVSSPSIKKIVILYKDLTHDSIEPYMIDIPEQVRKSGWKTGIVDRSNLKKNKAQNVQEISLFYHPHTMSILDNGEVSAATVSSNVIGFINNHLRYNSLAGFNFGPQSTKSGVLSIYPMPYSHYDNDSNGGSHIGLFLPLSYDKNMKSVAQSDKKIAPLFDANIPLEIPTNSPGDTVRVNISDFLVRDPPEKAEEILESISKRYMEYIDSLDKISVLDLEKRRELEAECKRDTSKLFSMYRNLPYRITNTKSSSYLSSGMKISQEAYSERVLASTTPYIPLADYVTCSRILRLREFSPEFGGHNLWPEGDSEAESAIKGAIEQMIIDLYNLDSLAEDMDKLLNDSQFKIESKDLLDPHILFDKIYLKVKKDNPNLSDSDVISTAIEMIRRVTAFPINNDYMPLSSIVNEVNRNIAIKERRFDLFWRGNKDKLTIQQNETKKKFSKWLNSQGRYYIVSGSKDDDGNPTAKVKVVSDPFPFNSGGTRRVDRLKAIQDPDNIQIIGQGDLHYQSVLLGTGVSAVKYAQGISEFISRSVADDLRGRIKLEKERILKRSNITGYRPISKTASLLESSIVRIRVASHESVATIRKAAMESLLSMFKNK